MCSLHWSESKLIKSEWTKKDQRGILAKKHLPMRELKRLIGREISESNDMTKPACGSNMISKQESGEAISPRRELTEDISMSRRGKILSELNERPSGR